MITKIFGTHDQKTQAQLEDVATRAEKVALMADGHMGFEMPIGGVVAYRDQLSVLGVGFDIACGNAAILTDKLVSDSSLTDLQTIANEIQSDISCGMGRTCKADDAP